jgi:hypothetical protein
MNIPFLETNHHRRPAGAMYLSYPDTAEFLRPCLVGKKSLAKVPVSTLVALM